MIEVTRLETPLPFGRPDLTNPTTLFKSHVAADAREGHPARAGADGDAGTERGGARRQAGRHAQRPQE